MHASGPRLETAFVDLTRKATPVLSPELLYSTVALALQRMDGAASGGSRSLTWALSLRLVVAAKPRRSNPKGLTLMGRLFTIAPLDAAVTVRLKRWIRFGAHVRTVLLRPPRTFLAWRECIQALQAGIAESQLAIEHGNLQLCRSLCLFAMARAGIPQLEVMQATGSQASVPFMEAQSLAELSRWFPNPCIWNGPFAGAVDVSVAMRSLGYCGRPELLTLWLHLAGNTQTKKFISEAGICTVHGRNVSHEDFRHAVLDLLRINGIPPTPLRVLQSMCASKTGAPLTNNEPTNPTANKTNNRQAPSTEQTRRAPSTKQPPPTKQPTISPRCSVRSESGVEGRGCSVQGFP